MTGSANPAEYRQLAVRISEIEDSLRRLNNRDVLQNASIGANGLVVYGGGSITVQDGGSILVTGTGSITLPSGTLSAGGLSISGNGSISGTLTVGAISFGSASGGSLSTSGGITASGGVQGSDLYTINGPGFNITGTRVASWLESATGRVGTATSSARFKTNIVPAGIDPAAVLSIGVKHFNYIDALKANQADPRIQVHLEVGAIAEEMHAAGLWEFVVYERDIVYDTRKVKVQIGTDEAGNPIWEKQTQQIPISDTLRLDENGQPIPFGIHYDMFSLAVLAAAQGLDARLRTVEAKLGVV